MIYELDYDLLKFGDILFKIRSNRKLTQKKIREITGIHPDTIKGIEYGQRFPTLDTLNKLGDLYQINLLNILSECKLENDPFLGRIISKINSISYLDEIEQVDDQIIQLEEFCALHNNSLHPKIKIRIEQLKILSNTIKIKNKKDVVNTLELERLCHKALQMNHPTFNECRLNENYYSLLEIRLLFVLGASKARQDKYRVATEIVEYANKQLHYQYLSDKTLLPDILNGYYTLSYHYFFEDKHLEVIKTCDKAIQLANQQYTTKFLPHFHFRKGISQFKMNIDGYMKNLLLSIEYLKLNGDNLLIDKFNQVLKEKYNIVLDQEVSTIKSIK
ncbi:helix-turn-helix transcriptional regulator [Acidaminobacter sp. JC074]|uniref:helix-turn-helix domain-containing protein n=1 Tax=Acidaminobacter sp. JC074 TaxID=2530199 RepID=UPI001F0E6BC1|nr:helix-turn-helix transcriptional regulator [Acidaminobacter sp. JC074]MCH4887934.1 helix-turn-helix transcriptional regulator [Acidaminobacter sp. JC074]